MSGTTAASGYDQLLLEISRAEVESLDVGPALLRLEAWGRTPTHARESRGRVRVALRGYMHDDREVFRIDEVRDYFTGLVLAFPSWLFFADPDGDSLRLIALSTCEPTGEAGCRPSLHADELRPFLNAHLDAMQLYAQQVSLPTDETERMMAAASRTLSSLAPMRQSPKGGLA
jgi:hypothetical protein